MQYGAVVVTFNRQQLLIESITALMQQTVPPAKIIIIDNHSTDDTRDALQANGILANPSVDYRYLDQNIGGAGGFARGMQIAQADPNLDWVSLSDDDAIFEPDYFEKLIAYQADHPTRQILTGSVYVADGRLQADQRNRFTSWSTFRTQAVPASEYDGNFEFDQYTFCGVFMSLAIVKQVGVADAGFFIWWDDCEYAVRTAKLVRPVNVSAAKLIHKTYLPSLDLKTKFIPDWRLYYGLRNRFITIKRWRANPVVSLAWLSFFYARLLVKLCGPFYRGYRKMVFKAYVQSLRDAAVEKEGLNPNFMPGQKF
ncbi:glycosyltransferase family 2 protein [Lactiplantibacillus paraplantarum]|uniref:glycosyltransferase family 2 protein n=1 Tax=Lactiplantibacillus paraplantarum TaxID=60520 RepID=UPI0023AB13A1|nr:glycosyltransferase family 2 protein [Lactiplantibacillus paraplantarum]WEE36944.1 glycosyltransferase family 2 protein [Lactiplantibacillus paraplantarum]